MKSFEKVGIHIGRAVILATFFSAWYGVYAALNSRGAEQCVFWSNPGVYFQPAVYIYFFVAVVVAPLPFLWHRRWESFFRLLFAYAFVSSIFFAIYYFFPVCMARGSYGGTSVADALMRIIVGLDDQANCFPSNHCMFATLGVLGTWRGGARNPVVVAVALASLAVCVSTVLVGQHYVWDVIVAIPLAALCFEVSYGTLFRPNGTSEKTNPQADHESAPRS